MRSLEFDFRNFPWYKLRGKRKCGITNKYFLASPLSAPFWLGKKAIFTDKPKIYIYQRMTKSWNFYFYMDGGLLFFRQAGREDNLFHFHRNFLIKIGYHFFLKTHLSRNFVCRIWIIFFSLFFRVVVKNICRNHLKVSTSMLHHLSKQVHMYTDSQSS